MSLRRAIVEADPRELNVTEFCRVHGVSTWFFWDLRRRHELEGDVVLSPKSRAPHRRPSRTPDEIEDLIIAKRKWLDDEGLDAGPGSIAAYLADVPGIPSEATIWRILTDRGLITPQPSKAPKSSKSFTAERANECWALDDTGWALADGSEVKILNVIDDHSRLCVVSTALAGACTGEATLAALAHAAPFVGWPQRIWSDNARAFRHTLAAALVPLGVAASHTKPYHPNSNGKIERFHQTAKKWLAKRDPAATIVELQHQLDEFRHFYNTQRPHRGINRRIPADVWTTAPKTGPSTQPVTATTTVYDTIVHDSRAFAGAYAITIGATHNGQQALTVITGVTCHVFVNGHLARKLTLDPGRRSQPYQPRPTTITVTEREDPRHA